MGKFYSLGGVSMKIIEPKVIHHFRTGVPEGENVESYHKKYSEVSYLYQDSKRDDDPIVYDVYSYTEGDSQIEGHLYWGLTILKPLYFHDECNMTKGHFHEDRNCSEIYFGIAGEGLLLLMNEDGKCWAEKIFEGSLHYIDGHIAHRLINTGDTELKVAACWPTTAGHDYQAIEQHPFPYRVFKKNNKIEFVRE